LDSNFDVVSKCFCSYLRSKQLHRPFPLKLFTDCVLSYKERLIQSQSQLKSLLTSNPDLIPFYGSNVTETQRKIEGTIVKTLSLAIDVQIHLENLLLFLSEDFCDEVSNEELLFEFNKVLNSLYFSLPMQLIWKLFARERAPVDILQGMLILTRKILKKGYSNSEIVECGATCWSKAISYPPILMDSKVRTVFRITIPLIINTLLRARNLGNLAAECDRYRDEEETLMLDSFDPRTFSLNLTQLTAYVLATGCLSFSNNTEDDLNSSFRKECETFWGLVLGNIFQIPGGNAETICLLLDDLHSQNINDCESDAGRVFPALMIVTTSLINGSELSNAENSNYETSELLIDALIPRLSVQQTSLLLSLPGFPYLLLLGKPSWNALTQKMQSNKTSESGTSENSEEERLSLSQIGGKKFALFIAEQFVSLPSKLEVPASTLFYQSDPFRINLLRMLTLVVRLDKVFLNRLCLGRFIETVVSLLTDSRCELSGNLLNLLRILNACLLMADENGVNQVTPHITERLSVTKASWLYARRPLLKMTNSLLMEEICVLGVLLMFGEGPNKLYSTITPFRNNENDGIYCASHFISILPIFTIPDVLLHSIRGRTVAMVSQRACCSAALLLLHAPNGLQMGPWPSYEESPKCDFYLKLQASLYSNLMDSTLKPFQILLSSLLGRMLKQGSQEALNVKAPRRGTLFGESIWNQLVLENLQLEEINEKDDLPYSISLLAFLAELLSSSPKLLITSLDAKLLQDLVVLYAQQPAHQISPRSPYAFLQNIVDVLSKNDAVTFLSSTSRKAIKEKLHVEGYAPQEPTLPSLGAYRRFLLPELSMTFR
uniref:Protein dopey-2 n=1 Tax=Hymenolepis diminuta TaxID=6216 RepID=A0A0R3SQK4_HYMDI